MYRKYYSYSDMPQIIKKNDCVAKSESPKPQIHNPPETGSILSKLSTDDILIAIIILALLMDDNADNTLLFALAFVFLSGLL